MRYYLETSFILSLFLKEDSYKKAINFIEQNPGTYYISSLVVLESLYNIQKLKLSIKDFLEFIEVFEIVNFTFEDILESIKVERLKIFDALHYILAKKINAKLITFDKEFFGLEDVIVLE